MVRKNAVLDRRSYMLAYFPGDSFMHALNPFSKLLLLIYITIITLIASSLIFLAIFSALLILLTLSCDLSIADLFHKLKFLIIIMIFSVILNIFFNALPNENNIVLFYLFGLEFLPIRKMAVYYALKAFFIIISLFTSTIIFTNTTSMKDFVDTLMCLKIPYKYCYAFMTGIRYIPIIEEEVKTINLAQKARGFSMESVKTLRQAYKLIFERLTTALISILRKGYVTSISMENRCFGIYKSRTNLGKIKFRKKDTAFIIFTTIIFTIILLYFFKILPLPSIPSISMLMREFSS